MKSTLRQTMVCECVRCQRQWHEGDIALENMPGRDPRSTQLTINSPEIYRVGNLCGYCSQMLDQFLEGAKLYGESARFPMRSTREAPRSEVE